MLCLQSALTFTSPSSVNYPQPLSQRLIYEIQLNWQFIRRDLWVSIVPCVLFGITALVNYPVQSSLELLTTTFKEALYAWLCITTFCISSQLVGIEEDRHNKPDRPLITRLVTPDGARQRWIIAMFALTSLGACTGTLLWALTWQLGCLVYDYAGGARHWYLKTLLGGIGVTSEIGAAWQLVEPSIAPIVWRWIIVIASYLITLMAVQDFRDIPGDRAVGRRTMPIAFGETISRYIISAGFFGFPLIVHYLLMVPAGDSATVIGWDLFLGGFAITIGLRTLLHRTPAADHGTYVGFTILFCAYLASSIFILRV